MPPEPREVVERFLRDGRDPETGRWRMDVIEQCFDVDRYHSHTWGGDLVTTGQRMGRFFGAFAQREPLSSEVVAEGPFVVHRSSFRVTVAGPVLGVEASGRRVDVHHVEMWRVEDGKIVEHWGGVGEAWHLYSQITDPDPADPIG